MWSALHKSICTKSAHVLPLLSSQQYPLSQHWHCIRQNLELIDTHRSMRIGYVEITMSFDVSKGRDLQTWAPVDVFQLRCSQHSTSHRLAREPLTDDPSAVCSPLALNLPCRGSRPVMWNVPFPHSRLSVPEHRECLLSHTTAVEWPGMLPPA